MDRFLGLRVEPRSAVPVRCARQQLPGRGGLERLGLGHEAGPRNQRRRGQGLSTRGLEQGAFATSPTLPWRTPLPLPPTPPPTSSPMRGSALRRLTPGNAVARPSSGVGFSAIWPPGASRRGRRRRGALRCHPAAPCHQVPERRRRREAPAVRAGRLRCCRRVHVRGHHQGGDHDRDQAGGSRGGVPGPRRSPQARRSAPSLPRTSPWSPP